MLEGILQQYSSQGAGFYSTQNAGLTGLGLTGL